MDKLDYQNEQGISVIIKLKNKVLNILARFMVLPAIRLFLYRRMGISVGKGVFIGLDCYLDDEVPKLITIEESAIVAFRVTIVAHDDTGTKTAAPVVLKRGCYIGTGAIILKGVTIGKGAVVGAGAVVTKSVDDGKTVVGVPARPIL